MTSTSIPQLASAARVRPATCADAPGIAYVHVESWRTTYRGLMPDQVLAALSIERREEMWRRQLCTENPDGGVFVAERDGLIVGIASLGPPDEEFPGYDAELQTIYLLESEQGRGTGHRLFQTAVDALHARGVSSFMLMVLRDNHRARRVYDAHGGTVIGEKRTERGGKTIIEVTYAWTKLDNCA